MITQMKLAFIGALAATAVLGAPIRRRAVEFSSVDISRTPGDGNAAQTEAQAVCPQSDGPDVLEDKRLAAEAAEVDVFNPAIAAAQADGNEELENALNCQKNRNKVLKNTCQLMKALLENNQSQIDENNEQIPANAEQVDNFCPDADASLFIGEGANDSTSIAPPARAAATAANAQNTQETADDDSASQSGVQQSSATPSSFADIDISRQAGDGQDAVTAAQAVCPSSDGADLLETKRQLSEDAERNFFNPAIEAAEAEGDDATAQAIQCQKDRNKALKNTCQLEKALLENDQAQIDENNTQIQANIEDVDDRCPGVDESLFISPDGASGSSANAANNANAQNDNEDSNNEAAETNNEDCNNDAAQTNNEDSNNDAAEANNEDSNNDAAEANNEDSNNDAAEANNEDSNNDAAEANNEDSNNDAAQTNNEDSNNDAAEANIEDSNNDAAQNNENSDNAADGTVQFDDIDISKQAGGGDEALAAAQSVCPTSDGAELLEAKRRVAEDTEVEKFNPAIEAAKASNNEALETALLCQQNRNKVLKNTCQLERALIENDQEQIDENNQQIPSNMEQVDNFCADADESLFI